jgi:TolB-like protein/Tfp pilus assembly protein PilF
MAEGGHADDGVYEFGDFRLLAAQRRLTARLDGRAIELTPKALDTLHFLVRHPGELLDKSALIAAVWPNVVVEENNLNQVISALRRALGDGSAGRRFIVTVPGRGYQFVAPVRQVAPAEASPAPAVQARGGDRASIAVLPFASLSSDPEKDYFGDGIAEELIHLLARVPGLKVPARTSSFAYKGRNVDVRQIARELGVGMLLEGSVRSAGDNIRVTAQLVDAESGYHIWSQTFDRQFADVFRLQDELAGAIVQKLELNLGSPAEPVRHEPPTRSVEAYRLYMQARAVFFSGGLTVDRISRMLAMLERSIGLDPDFARAHALRGFALQLQLGSRSAEALDESMREAERALELDAGLAEAHSVLGMLQAARAQWLEADASFRRAIALDPNEPAARITYSLYGLAAVGRQRAAIEEAHRAYELAPGMASAAMSLAGAHGLAAHDKEMAEYLQVVSDLGAPAQAPIPIFRSEIARRAGRPAEAAELIIEVLPEAVRATGGDDTVRRMYHALGDAASRASAVSALRTLYAGLDTHIAEGWPMVILTLEWYVLLGALDDAYVIARRIARQLEHGGHLIVLNLPPVWLPELAPFRRDPRFHEFSDRLGFFEYWKARGPPDGYALQNGRLVERPAGAPAT